MVRLGQPHFTERRRNENIVVAGVGGESIKGRKPSPFWSLSEMIRKRSTNLKPLHNFALPRLRWGSQIPMRCMKAADHSTSALSSSSSISADCLRPVQRSFKHTSFAASPEAVEEEDGEGIEAVREKLMLDLKTETDKIRKELLKEDDDDRGEAAREVAVPKEGGFEGGMTDVTATAQSRKDGGAETRPWNLRTRRAGFRAPAERGEGGVAGKEKVWPGKEKEREKFSLGLKRKEIEEDFMKLTGHRPPRRPRAVQKKLDMLFPGSWLTEITADAYKVVELPDDGK